MGSLYCYDKSNAIDILNTYKRADYQAQIIAEQSNIIVIQKLQIQEKAKDNGKKSFIIGIISGLVGIVIGLIAK